jgi:hypothetical protein
MPRANRVTPIGTFEASPARGCLMGNRGDLHDREGRIARAWRGKAWISCTLEPRSPGYRVIFDQRGHYTPLFFLDEVVALSAGHRPCALCRRPAYNAFRAALAEGLDISVRTLSAPAMDQILHQARLPRDAAAAVEKIAALPDGAFVLHRQAPHLLWNGRLHPWSHAGYGPASACNPESEVQPLTPAPILAALKAGYRPLAEIGVG